MPLDFRLIVNSLNEYILQLAVLAALLYIFTPFVWSTQVVLTQAKATSVSELIQVNGELDFSKVLPGQSYYKELEVNWLVPKQALELKDTELKVILAVKAINANSKLRFSNSREVTNEYTSELTCVLKNKKCTEESKLSEKFLVLLELPLNYTGSYEDAVEITAKLKTQEKEEDLIQIAKEILGNLVQEQNAKKDEKKTTNQTNNTKATEVNLQKNQNYTNSQTSNASGDFLAQNSSLIGVLITLLGLIAIYAYKKKHEQKKW